MKGGEEGQQWRRCNNAEMDFADFIGVAVVQHYSSVFIMFCVFSAVADQS